MLANGGLLPHVSQLKSSPNGTCTRVRKSSTLVSEKWEEFAGVSTTAYDEPSRRRTPSK